MEGRVDQDLGAVVHNARGLLHDRLQVLLIGERNDYFTERDHVNAKVFGDLESEQSTKAVDQPDDVAREAGNQSGCPLDDRPDDRDRQ